MGDERKATDIKQKTEHLEQRERYNNFGTYTLNGRREENEGK